ncbi:hypothetical protein [Streptomyces sp. NPDC004830]
MGLRGEHRRRARRAVVIVWVLLVAAAGGLTLWMRDSAEPAGPYVWQNAEPGETYDLPPCPMPGAGRPASCAYADPR